MRVCTWQTFVRDTDPKQSSFLFRNCSIFSLDRHICAQNNHILYKRGETSQKAKAKKHSVSQRAFQDWIRRYETFGAEGFENTGNRKYSSELKESAVQAYLNGEGSHAEICKKYGISSRGVLQKLINTLSL